MAKKRKLEASPAADRRELRRVLEAAKADHWDDGPRLALADWLEEHGGEADRARAEVIRLQLETANGGPSWHLTVTKLRDKHVREWVGPHRAFFNRKLPQCERGLLVAESPLAAWIAADTVDDEAWAWVEAARIAAPTTAEAPGLMASPRLAGLSRLEFTNGVGPEATDAVAAHAESLRALYMTINAANVGRLCRALRPGLVELRLGLWGTQRRDLPPLFGCAGVRGLHSLSLEGSEMDDGDAASLAGSPGLRRLRKLEADTANLSPDGFASLARLSLRRLCVSAAPQGLAALTLLADSACRDTLEELRLWSCMSGDRMHAPSPVALPRLRRLVMRNGLIAPREVASLASSFPVGRLDELDLSGNNLGAEGVATLGDAGPRTLRLAECGLGNDGAARLAAWPGLARVRFLDVSNNGIGNDGLRALADSPHAGALEALDLDYNRRIVAKGITALLRSPLGERLRWLSLDGVSSPVAIAKAFIACRPPTLRELCLGFHNVWRIGGEAMIRLRAKLPGCAIG